MKDPDVARLHAMAEAREANGDPRLAMLYRDAADALDRIVVKRAEREAHPDETARSRDAAPSGRIGA